MIFHTIKEAIRAYAMRDLVMKMHDEYMRRSMANVHEKDASMTTVATNMIIDEGWRQCIEFATDSISKEVAVMEKNASEHRVN